MKKLVLLLIVAINTIMIVPRVNTKQKVDEVYKKSLEDFKNEHKISLFINEDYIFNNESLNKPKFIKYNLKTNEVVIFDEGNMCFYVFSREGKYLNKFGQVGQGPAEYLSVDAFDIDKEGNIYIFDSNNIKINIYTSSGEYINSFRLGRPYRNHMKNTLIYRMFINDTNNTKEIIFNNPTAGYYITVYSIKGEVLKEIGKIQDYKNKHPLTNYVFAEGCPFVDKYGNYSIILVYLFDILTYDINGKLIDEKNLDKILGTDKKTILVNPREEDFSKYFVTVTSIQQIIARNSRINIIFNTATNGSTKIYEMNYDYQKNNQYIIYIPEEIYKKRLNVSFELLDNRDVYLISPKHEKVYKYEIKE